MGDWDDDTPKPTAKKSDSLNTKDEVVDFMMRKDKEKKDILFSDEQVADWAKEGAKPMSKVCCLTYGADGVGKTGIVYDYLTEEDVKNGKSMWVIDLDGGGQPLKQSYHKNKGESLVVIDPLITFEGKHGTEIDYKGTFAKIRAIVRYVKTHYEEKKIKAVVFDGLSTALGYAEKQMRLDKNLDTDGGVQLRYWLNRNKLFLETLEQVRSLPIARFFIAHENFIMPEKGEVSSVVAKTNAMMIQKIKCGRVVTPTDVKFTATIDKSKYNVVAEGQRIEFCTVNKADKKYTWKTSEIFDVIEGGK